MRRASEQSETIIRLSIRNLAARTVGRCEARRGVLLLIVLTILALFSVVAVTFALVAGKHRQVTTKQSRMEQYSPDPRDLLDDGAMQLVRGSKNPVSPFFIHSLLEDMYGNDGLSSARLA